MFARMSRLAGDPHNSLAHDVEIMGAAGNQASFDAARERALVALLELQRFVRHATFEQARASQPAPWDGREGCGLTAVTGR